jgi:hypothetical protein
MPGRHMKRSRPARVQGDKLILATGEQVPIAGEPMQLDTALQQTIGAPESTPLPLPSNQLSIPSTTDLDLLRERISALAVTGLSAKSIARRLNCNQAIVTTTIKATRSQIENMSADIVAKLVSKLFVSLTVASGLVTAELIRRIICNQLRIEGIEQGTIDPMLYCHNDIALNPEQSKLSAINTLTEEIDKAIGRLGKFSADLTGSLAAMGVPRLAKREEKGTQQLLSTTTEFYKSLGSKKEVLDELLQMNKRQGEKLREMKRERERAEVEIPVAEEVPPAEKNIEEVEKLA